MTRPCDVAVENSRSMHSEAKLTAVSKPNVDVVFSRSLSIVLGTPTRRSPASCRRLAIVIEPSPPTVIEGVDAVGREQADELLGAVDLGPRAVGLLHRVGARVAAVGRADDRAALVDDAAHRLARQPDDAALRVQLGRQQAVEAVADADDVPAPVAGRERGGADDGVQARGVTAARC